MQLVFVAFDGYFLRSSMLLSMPTPIQLLVDLSSVLPSVLLRHQHLGLKVMSSIGGYYAESVLFPAFVFEILVDFCKVECNVEVSIRCVPALQ